MRIHNVLKYMRFVLIDQREDFKKEKNAKRGKFGVRSIELYVNDKSTNLAQ